jgi:hypothetical protein
MTKKKMASALMDFAHVVSDDNHFRDIQGLKTVWPIA